MVVVDTSALAAILFDEPEQATFAEFLVRNRPLISAATVVEAESLMLRRKGWPGLERVRWLLREIPVVVEPLHPDDLVWTREALNRFGRGRREPPAVLNFGDLFAYALARHLNAPLLFKGNDFALTDIKPALPT